MNSLLAGAVAIQLFCATQFPTTTTILQQTQTGYTLSLINHNGVKYMPIHNGSITTNDLKMLSLKSALLTKIGDMADITFTAKQCTQTLGEWECRKPELTKVGELETKGVGFTLQKRQFKSASLEYEYYTAELSLHVGNMVYFVPMDYLKEYCQFK